MYFSNLKSNLEYKSVPHSMPTSHLAIFHRVSTGIESETGTLPGTRAGAAKCSLMQQPVPC